MGRSHIKEVAKLHGALLNGLLAGLGEVTTRAFYRAYLESPSCIAFVDEAESHEVHGFVLGSDEPSRLRKDAVSLPLLMRTAASAATRPRVWSWLLDTRAVVDPHVPELTYIASTVSGVGGALLLAFESALRARGIKRYELSVDSGNERAIRFYEHKGLQRGGTYEQFGATHFRYKREL